MLGDTDFLETDTIFLIFQNDILLIYQFHGVLCFGGTYEIVLTVLVQNKPLLRHANTISDRYWPISKSISIFVFGAFKNRFFANPI